MQKKLLVVLLLNLGLISAAFAEVDSISEPEPSTTFFSPTIQPFAPISQPLTTEALTSLQLQELKYGKGFIAIGNISTSITEKIAIKPDTADFSITYITEGSTPNDASNRNATNMKKLNEYLNELGIKDDNLTTVSYRNYEQEKYQTDDNSEQGYVSTFTIQLDIDKNKFLDVVKLLDENQINDIQQDSYHKYYQFKIKGFSDSEDKAKQISQNKYQSIVLKLYKLGMKNISIARYDTEEAKPDSTRVKKYYVSNTIKIKVNNLESIGKIITKAQELKMTVNNDINYSVSESKKNEEIAKYEQTIYSKLAAKAFRLVGQQYQLGVATNLSTDDGDNNNNNNYYLQSSRYGFSGAMINSGQVQNFAADSVEIQLPSEFTMMLTMKGTFEIIQKIKTVQ